MLAGGLLAGPLAVAAQPVGKVPRIGFIGNSTAALEANLVTPWRGGLRVNLATSRARVAPGVVPTLSHVSVLMNPDSVRAKPELDHAFGGDHQGSA